MYPKTETEAIHVAHNLYEIWVGRDRRFPMLDAIQASIRDEMRMNRQLPARTSAANKRETLRDLRIASYIANRYPKVGTV